MKRLVLLSFLIISCAQPQIAIHKKSGIDFANYKKIAVIKFDCAKESVGQEVAEAFFNARAMGGEQKPVITRR